MFGPLKFGFQGFQFTLLQVGALKFIILKLHIIQVLFQPVDLIPYLRQFLICLTVSRCKLAWYSVSSFSVLRQVIDHLQLVLMIVKLQVLMLGMNIHQPVPDLLQHRQVYRSIIDKCP